MCSLREYVLPSQYRLELTEDFCQELLDSSAVLAGRIDKAVWALPAAASASSAVE